MLPSTGTYALIFHLDERHRVRIGSLGTLEFEPGDWTYVGSGQGRGSTDLRGRLRRHLSTAERGAENPHWHIDHLLDATRPRIKGAWLLPYDAECELARSLSRRAPGVPGFGCSDCDCESHLFHAGLRETSAAVAELKGGIFVPEPALRRWVSQR